MGAPDPSEWTDELHEAAGHIARGSMIEGGVDYGLRGLDDVLEEAVRTAYERGRADNPLSARIEALMAEHTDPDRWDGEEDAETLQERFLEWLPDTVLHATAVQLMQLAGTANRANGPGLYLASTKVDPFRLCEDDGCDRSPHWVRKRDGVDVPWEVIGDAGA